MSRLEGYILDNTNTPVENATVTIPAAGLFALSDERGSFVIDDVPPGVYTVYVVHRKFQKLGADVNISEDMVVTFNLDN